MGVALSKFFGRGARFDQFNDFFILTDEDLDLRISLVEKLVEALQLLVLVFELAGLGCAFSDRPVVLRLQSCRLAFGGAQAKL